MPAASRAGSPVVAVMWSSTMEPLDPEGGQVNAAEQEGDRCVDGSW